MPVICRQFCVFLCDMETQKIIEQAEKHFMEYLSS